jgi:hypothetical protein
LSLGGRRELKEGEQERERELQVVGPASTAISISNRVPTIVTIDVVQYTVFGPTNAAFSKLPKATTNFLFSDKGTDMLRDIVRYHIIENRRIIYQDLVCDKSFSMTNGEDTRTKCRNDGFTKFQVGDGNTIRPVDDEPQIVFKDIFVANGVLHVVDEVILPKPTSTPPTTFNQCCPKQADTAQTCVDSMEFVYTRSLCAKGAPDGGANNAVPGYCIDTPLINGGQPPATIQLFPCGNNFGVNPLLNFVPVTNGERIFIRSADLGAVQCLPKCVQVKIVQDASIVQVFNINTSCANNNRCGYSVPSNGLCPADCPFYAGFPGAGTGATCGVPGIAEGCPASVPASLCAPWDGFGGLGTPGFNTGSLQFVDFKCPANVQGFPGLTPGCGASPPVGDNCPAVCPRDGPVPICSF